MTKNKTKETLIETKVTFTLLKDDKFYIIENVPARVDQETGEELFFIQTVEHLQRLVLDKKKPIKTLETPVYAFA